MLPRYLKYKVSNEVELVWLDYYKKKGIDSNQPDENGQTPLSALFLNNHKLALEILKAWKSETEVSKEYTKLKEAVNTADNDDCTPLLNLLRGVDQLEPIEDALMLLMECGAKLSIATKENVITVLHIAVSRAKTIADVEIIRKMLAMAPDVFEAINIADKEGWTPLHFVKLNRESAIPLAKLLIDHNAYAIEDKDGFFPDVLNAHGEVLSYYLDRMKRKRENQSGQ